MVSDAFKIGGKVADPTAQSALEKLRSAKPDELSDRRIDTQSEAIAVLDFDGNDRVDDRDFAMQREALGTRGLSRREFDGVRHAFAGALSGGVAVRGVPTTAATVASASTRTTDAGSICSSMLASALPVMPR